MRERLWRRPLPMAGAGAVGAATLALWFVSRGKWSDAIIDSGREWIVPDALARGALLYRDVVYWFGPFTPYLHALLFRLLGSGFSTLVVSGVVGSLCILAALFVALRRVTGQVESLLGTALAIPALLFMPAAGGAILGMGYRMWHAAVFTLLAGALALAPSRSAIRAVGIGCLCGLAGLCRIEWGLAALAGVCLMAAVRHRFRASCLQEILLFGVSSLLLSGGVLAAFVALAGSDAVLREGHVLLTGLPPETRRFLLYLSGFHDPRGGLLRLLCSVALWIGIFLLIRMAAAWKENRERVRRGIPWIAGIALFLVLYGGFGGTLRMLLMSGLPAMGAIAVVFGIRRGSGVRAAALIGFGALATLLSYRRLFNIEDLPYVGPPLLFALVSALAVLRELVLSEKARAARARLELGVRAALIFLVFLSFSDRILHYRRDSRVMVPGSQGMLSAGFQEARALALVSETIRGRTGPSEGLVVFPEGEALNFLSGRSNPMRHKLTLPGYLSDENEGDVLADLASVRPRAVVITNRETPEYGRRLFGKNYGKRVYRWIEENYDACPIGRPEDSATSLGRLYLSKR